MFFDKKIAFFDLEAANRNEALKRMADSLYAADMVEASFYKGILQREAQFPTGLPTIPYGVAIPHAEPDRVKTPQIAFASLKSPVTFQMMGTNHEEVEVSLIFMLALKKAEDQLTMLQKLTDVFQNSSLLTDFARCKNQEELDELLSKAGLN